MSGVTRSSQNALHNISLFITFNQSQRVSTTKDEFPVSIPIVSHGVLFTLARYSAFFYGIGLIHPLESGYDFDTNVDSPPRVLHRIQSGIPRRDMTVQKASTTLVRLRYGGYSGSTIIPLTCVINMSCAMRKYSICDFMLCFE